MQKQNLIMKNFFRNFGADRLYYSAIRGASVENGVVSTVTNEYNPLEIIKKLSAIYTF